MVKQSKTETLESVLKNHDFEAIINAMANMEKELYDQAVECSPLQDPGKITHPGEDKHVEFNELPYIERIIQERNFLPVHFLEEGAKTQRAVARVALVEAHRGLPAESGWGTGFMISPTLYMTNNHVIPNVAFCDKVKIQFNFQLNENGNAQTVEEYRLEPNNFFYTNASLDFTIVRVKAKCDSFQLPTFNVREDNYRHTDDYLYELTPDPNQIDPRISQANFNRDRFNFDIFRPFKCTVAGRKWGFIPLNEDIRYALDQHVNIIQHPRGRRKEVALQKNQLERIQRNVVKYTTDTEPGSSGSPVFNNSWDLIALHHAGGDRNSGGTFINNEAIRIDRIIEDIRRSQRGDATGNRILRELGI